MLFTMLVNLPRCNSRVFSAKVSQLFERSEFWLTLKKVVSVAEQAAAKPAW